jgi:hypothetical protein
VDAESDAAAQKVSDLSKGTTMHPNLTGPRKQELAREHVTKSPAYAKALGVGLRDEVEADGHCAVFHLMLNPCKYCTGPQCVFVVSLGVLKVFTGGFVVCFVFLMFTA